MPDRPDSFPEIGIAVEEAARVQNVITDDVVIEAAKVARKRRKNMVLVVGFGVVWSFLFTSISLILMLNMSKQADDVCKHFAEAREVTRALVEGNPNFDAATVQVISEATPPIEC